ncbi:MAG: hypothetical protein B7X06_02095 [Verrucomicrobia bacterium 21-51-4]|nr:MAG: hypothetical protein B7X06_02095 [Verrucomicrobia bacterium 21-51-4]HQU08547.1 AEC family transporter [Opitutales bacterium]
MIQKLISLYVTLLSAVVPIFSITILGLLLRKFRGVSEEGERTLMRLAVSVLYPCLVFSVIMRFDLQKEMSGSVLIAPVFGFIVTTIGYLLCSVVMRVLKAPSDYARSFSASTGLFNFGYIAIPTCELVFGEQATAMLLIFNIGVDIALWLIGVPMLRGGWKDGIRGLKKLISAPIVAIIVSIFVSSIGGAAYIPDAFMKGVSWLGQCTIPIALMAMGASIYDLIHSLKWQASWRTGVLSCLLRLGILPALFLLLAYYAPVDTELKQTLVVQAAMPGGMLTIMLAKHYHVSPQTAAQSSIWTTAVSVITLPAWICLGMAWVLG